MAKTTPKVASNGGNSAAYLMIETPILVGVPNWFAWLEIPQNRAFIFESYNSSTSEKLWNFSAQKEERKDGFYWYGYKRFEGKLQRQYLGQGAELSLEKLLDAARKLSAKFHSSSTTEHISSKTIPLEFHDSSTTPGQSSQEQLELLRSQLQDCHADGERLASENVRLLAARQGAEAATEEVRLQFEKINNAFVDSKNEAWLNQKSSDHWQQIAKEREAEIEQLRSQLKVLAAEINAGHPGYGKNSFSQGIGKLKDILSLISVELNPPPTKKSK